MLVNLTDVFTSEGKTEERDVEIGFQDFRAGSEVYPVVASKPVHLTLTNIGENKAKIQCDASITLRMQCGRCLQDVDQLFTLSFEGDAVSPDVENNEDADDDQNFIEGYQLNVDDLIISEIFNNWPLRILCREDCKGICSVCGQNLNQGTCSCDTFVPDPRMAKFKDIFEANKEV